MGVKSLTAFAQEVTRLRPAPGKSNKQDRGRRLLGTLGAPPTGDDGQRVVGKLNTDSEIRQAFKMPTLLSVITGPQWYGLIALFKWRISSEHFMATKRMALQHLVIDRYSKSMPQH
jgi:hypothetical protein